MLIELDDEFERREAVAHEEAVADEQRASMFEDAGADAGADDDLLAAAAEPGAPEAEPEPEPVDQPSERMPARAQSLRAKVSGGASVLDPATAEREAAEAELLVAEVELRRRQFDAARKRLRERCLPVFQRHADLPGQASTWGKLAEIHELEGDFEHALAVRQQQLQAYQNAGAELEVAQTQAKIANLLARVGALENAITLVREQVVPRYERQGDIEGQSVALGQLAELLDAAGQHQVASSVRRDQQAPLLERRHDLRARALEFEQQARTRAQAGDHAGALLSIYRKIDDLQAQADTLVWVAAELAELGDIEQAAELLEHQALPALTTVGDVRGQALATERVAQLRAARRSSDGVQALASDNRGRGAAILGLLLLTLAIAIAWRACV